MKLSIEQVQKMAELQKQVVSVYKEMDYSSVTDSGVLMRDITFVETFETFAVSDREREEFPYELSTIAGGVRFYSIMSPADVVELEETHPDKFEYISHAIQRELA